MGEDRALRKGERVLRGSSDLTDSQEAPSYANYSALVMLPAPIRRCSFSECVQKLAKSEGICRCACDATRRLRATDKPSRIPRCQSAIPVCLFHVGL